MTIVSSTASRRRKTVLTSGLVAFTVLIGCALPVKGLDLDRKPTLRAKISVKSNIVTVADLFEGAGLTGPKAIFRAPDLGKTGTVSAEKVVKAARAAGLYDAEAGTLVDVVVTHEGREVTQADLQQLLADAITREAPLGENGEMQIVLDQSIDARLADAASTTPYKLAGLNYLPSTGRFEATVVIDSGTSNAADRLKLRGTATEVVRSLSLSRLVNRGDIIAAEDLTVEKVPRRLAGNARQIDAQQLIGLSAKRVMRPGQQLSLNDFSAPILVNKGEIVTLMFEVPGMVLTARGQALEAGTKGESIAILNQQSKRTIHGTVVALGRVQVTGGFQTIAKIDPATATGRLQQ